LLRTIFQEKIELEVICEPDLPLVEGDQNMLEQSLLNLALNARDAMPEGGEIFMETALCIFGEDLLLSHPDSKAKSGPYVSVSIHDSGCGIAPEHLTRIFEPFFTTKEVGKGTGLGLSTVYRFIEQHKGWIDVKSEPGEGASFTIYLPAATGKSSWEKTLRANVERSPRGSEMILVVEDEHGLGKMIAQILRQHGYRTLSADSGVEALDLWKLHREEIDLVLTDMVMPGGVSGQDLKELFSAEKPNLKVLLMSGHKSEPASPGQPLVLHKPYTPGLLLNTIRHLLDE
jgi:two-component system, cell cycle sensor histidine kinase and response regulator CckA